MTTPAQTAQGNDFVKDWPVQGPTDPGMRQADCRFAATLPQTDCPDCDKGWAGVSFAGKRVAGLSGPSDPAIWSSLSQDQQTWIQHTLAKLNDLIVTTTGTSCAMWNSGATWEVKMASAIGCFQTWFNLNYKGTTAMTGADGKPIVLRTDKILDQDTLNALIAIAGMNPTDFTKYPGFVPATSTDSKKLSTGAMVGIAAGGAVVLGGAVYLVTRKKRAHR